MKKEKTIKENTVALKVRINNGDTLTLKERDILRRALSEGKKVSISTCVYVEGTHPGHMLAPQASVIHIWER